MDGVRVENVSNKSLLLGDNLFEAAAITVAANATVPEGAALKRDGNNFAVATAADTLIAVNPVEIKNTTSAAKTFSIRAIISGRVRLDMVRVGAAALTTAQRDQLRGYGIVAVKVTDLSKLDNQ